MATGEKVFLQDKNGQNLLVASDWSMVQNRPNNLATTDQLPVLGPVQRDGIQFLNGGYDWDHVNNGYNCTYRIANLGSFKLIELRMMFGCDHDLTSETTLITLPKIVQADENLESWWPTNWGNVYIHLRGNEISAYVGGSTGVANKFPANNLLSFHMTYLSAL